MRGLINRALEDGYDLIIEELLSFVSLEIITGVASNEESSVRGGKIGLEVELELIATFDGVFIGLVRMFLHGQVINEAMQ